MHDGTLQIKRCARSHTKIEQILPSTPLHIAVGSALSYLEYVGQGVEQVEPGVDGLLRSRLHPSELLSLLHPVLSGIQGELPSLCPSPSCARPLNLLRKSYSYSWSKKI